jgi:hypothetical protein
MVEPHQSDTCTKRSDADLTAAVQLLGNRYLLPAATLSWQLEHESRFHTGSASRDRVLTAMLTYERALIEFFQRPKALKPGKERPPPWTRKDVCPWCFVPGWRLKHRDQELASDLAARWETISSRKSHLSWLEVHQPREWSDWKILNVLKAFDVFLPAVEAVKPKIAAELRQLVHQADRAYENGPGGLENHTSAGETESPGVAN